MAEPHSGKDFCVGENLAHLSVSQRAVGSDHTRFGCSLAKAPQMPQREADGAGCRVKSPLMKKEQLQTQVWVEQSCQEARRGPPPNPLHTPYAVPKDIPWGGKGGNGSRNGPWVLGINMQRSTLTLGIARCSVA